MRCVIAVFVCLAVLAATPLGGAAHARVAIQAPSDTKTTNLRPLLTPAKWQWFYPHIRLGKRYRPGSKGRLQWYQPGTAPFGYHPKGRGSDNTPGSAGVWWRKNPTWPPRNWTPGTWPSDHPRHPNHPHRKPHPTPGTDVAIIPLPTSLHCLTSAVILLAGYRRLHRRRRIPRTV